MIEEVLAEIEQAEQEAERILEAAREQARAISQSAVSEVEKFRADHARETKLAVSEILEAARVRSEKEAEAAGKEAEAAAQSVVRSAEKNVRAAGGWLAGKVIKNKF